MNELVKVDDVGWAVDDVGEEQRQSGSWHGELDRESWSLAVGCATRTATA